MLRSSADYNGILRFFKIQEKNKNSSGVSLHCFRRYMEMTKMNCKYCKTNRALNPRIKFIFILIVPQLFKDLDFIAFASIDFDTWEAEDFPRILTRDPALLPLLRLFLSRSFGDTSTFAFFDFSFAFMM